VSSPPGAPGRIPGPGALERWRAEIRAGRRQNTAAQFDALQTAACWELIARERETNDDGSGARWAMDVARLRLAGHLGLDPTSKRGKALLQELRAAGRDERQGRMMSWAEQNAARAKEYAS
jgi:hypothetical protein